MENMDVVGIKAEREKKLVEAERKSGDENGKRKVGRPRKIEKLRKEKRSSMGCLDEYLKNKKKGQEEVRIERGEIGVLKSSRKVEWSQEGGNGHEKEEWAKMMEEELRKMRERFDKEMEKLRFEIAEVRKWREEKKSMVEKIERLERRLRDLDV